ncbi:hypothetical protein PRIC1_010999 [Phytophthora ramorum]
MRRLRVDEVILLLSVVVYGVSSRSLVSGVGDATGFHALKTQRGSVDDPVTSLQIIYPVDGAVETAPVKLAMAINIRAGGAELYKELYSERSVCFESRNVTLACFPVNESWMGIKDCKAATYTVRAYFSETDENHKPIGERHWTSLPITFHVVSGADLAARATDFVRARQAKYRAGYDLSLVDWAAQQQQQRHPAVLKKLEEEQVGLPFEEVGGRAQDGELVLVIGVKTAVASNFALRQAVRETWASKEALPRGAKVLFVGCRPLSLVEESEPGDPDKEVERRRLREAVLLEKMVYGDLLTEELDCNDSYLDLANKVKEFLHVAATQYSNAQYVMLADDDVYVRVSELIRHFEHLGPQTRYYSGQVPSIQYGRKDTPNRNASSRYSLSVEQYPLSELPPMAMGAYFFLSMDCAKFVSKNRYRLHGLNGIDDITMPVWMLAIQVHVQHQANLGYLRANPCNDRFVAFGDLSPLALREVHSNLQEGRSFCHGFERNLWLKTSGDAVRNGLYRMLPWFPEPLEFGFVVAKMNKTDLHEIATIISTPASAGVKVSHFPAHETFHAYTRRICAEARLSFPTAVKSTSCSAMADRLKTEFQVFSEQTSEVNYQLN